MRQSALTSVDNADVTSAARFYLLIQPIATDTKDARDAAEEVAKLTGRDNYTILQKIVGHAPDILLISQDADGTMSACEKLRNAGYDSAIVSESQLRHNPAPRRAVAVTSQSSDSVTFIDINGNIICEIDSEANPFVVAGSLKPQLYGAGREMIRRIVGGDPAGADSKDTRIEDICKDSPALLIYQDRMEQPVLIVGSQFNYQSLGSQMKYSVAENFGELLAVIRRISSVALDTNFGQKTLPLTPLASRPDDEKDTLERLRVYGRLMWLAKQNGFGAPRQTTRETPAQTLTGIPLAGPLTTGAETLEKVAQPAASDNDNKTSQTAPASEEPSLPPAPPPLKHSGAFQFNLEPLKQLKRFGPPAITGGLLTLTLAGAAVSVVGGGFSLAFSAIPGGLFFCVWALAMLLRKRAIEQLPTSRIRSLPMGAVELCGEAIRKYDLIAPFSLTRCVYYSYEVLHLKISGYTDGRPVERWVVTERGESGRTPFYLRDETGAVTIDPTGAIISGMRVEEYAGGMLETLAGVKGDGRRKIIERVLPEGARLYVIGHARPLKNSASEARGEYRRRLKALKASPELIENYDADGDGHISVEEFARARADLEQKMSEERLAAQSPVDNSMMGSPADRVNESVVVGDNPNNGLFYISDKSEPDILKSYAWRIPLAAVAGFLALAWGVMNILGD